MDTAIMAGYMNDWNRYKCNLTQMAKHGYNALIFTHANIHDGYIRMAQEFLNTYIGTELLSKDIQKAKLCGATRILITVSLTKNSFNPKGSPETLAHEIIRFLYLYGFDGINFGDAMDISPEYFDKLCSLIQKIDKSVLLAASPMLYQKRKSQTIQMHTKHSDYFYNVAIYNKRFDYIFLKAFNDPTINIDGYTEKDAEFISASFKQIKRTVPLKTKIAIGQPPNDTICKFSVFNRKDKKDLIYKLIKDQYESICEGQQFGGAVVWDVNADCKNSYRFVEAVKNSIEPMKHIKTGHRRPPYLFNYPHLNTNVS
ncbi:hypothetical protein PQO03_08720 [Lentisphaera profundi]|uniref:GH18 domain-containing protein n=1 Tax=Lentisphaera profundi TaxID=1658616 RepID=A0ABY7VQ04_9BACT|nr:hypothetical protein [Lentisphaera profundi]WDE95797.1 hypothetical protein PQO03_08720 [Lentisphaera profundi]